MAEQLIATSTYTTEAVNDCPVSPTEAEYMSAKNNYIRLRQKWEDLTNKQHNASLVVGFASQAVSDLDEAGSTTEEVFSSLDEFSLTPLENELQDLEGYQSTIKTLSSNLANAVQELEAKIKEMDNEKQSFHGEMIDSYYDAKNGYQTVDILRRYPVTDPTTQKITYYKEVQINTYDADLELPPESGE